MAEGLTKTETKRVAVVTGSNKGIGLEICKQLASKGIVVVLTARNEKRGKEALENIKGSTAAALSDLVVFHELDVVDPASVASLADFVKTQFGKLDILVNNAGVIGVVEDTTAPEGALSIWNRTLIQNYELTIQCVETNYFGAKRMVEAFVPLLQLSDSPRIVNVSSTLGKLQHVSNEWAIGVFSDAGNLSEERVDEVVYTLLKDFKDDSLVAKGWPAYPAYTVSKAALNAYTRVLAKKYPGFRINSVCPGYVRTEINYNSGHLSVEEGAATPVKLALLPDGAPSGFFFQHGEIIDF